MLIHKNYFSLKHMVGIYEMLAGTSDHQCFVIQIAFFSGKPGRVGNGLWVREDELVKTTVFNFCGKPA